MGDKIIKDLDKNLFRQAQMDVLERKYIKEMYAYYEQEMSRNWTDDEKVIWGSDGNSKTGMWSYSTAPIISCMHNGEIPPCALSGNCYGISDMRLKSVREKAVHNTVLILKYPKHFKRSLREKFMLHNCIRGHVEGDFVNATEIRIVDEVCYEFPYTTFNTYTKKYALMNAYVRDKRWHRLNGGFKPSYSGWDGMEMDNPYNFPVVHVYATLREYLESNDYRKCGRIEENADGSYTFYKGNCRQCYENHIKNIIYGKDFDGGCFDLCKVDNPEDIMSVGMLAH